MNAAAWELTAAMMAFDVDAGGEIYLVHAGGASGTIAADDLLEGRIRVLRPLTGDFTEYGSVEDAALAGWRPSPGSRQAK